jgi:protein gp37
MHLGVSAENQETYDERVPVLVHQCRAALFWVSLEPLLGPVKLRGTGHIHLGWVVVGGESGNGARPFDVGWAESLIAEGAESEIPVFFKQKGRLWYDTKRNEGMRGSVAVPVFSDWRWHDFDKDDPKSSDMERWAPELRVREFPTRAA